MTRYTMTEHVTELSRPFPKNYVHDDGRGNAYVPHHIVTQRLIHIFGAPPRIEVLRELYDEGKLTGVVMRLTVPGFDPVEEAGEADNPQSKTNGARAKDACSDAIKRCAMRLGCGLHLWAQQDYFLFDALTKSDGNGAQGDPETAAAPQPAHETPVEKGTPEGDNPADTGKGSPSGDPVLTAKRIQLKNLCKAAKPKLVAEKLAFDAYEKNLNDLTEQELDELLGSMTGKVSA